MNTLITLSKGENKVFDVFSRCLWNRSGIQLENGNAYKIEVTGNQWWVDFYIPTGADGYSFPLLRSYESSRRVPNQNWFKLIGTIGNNIQNPIIIGRKFEDYIRLETGELFCFANDMETMYWNNWGSLRITVTRTG